MSEWISGKDRKLFDESCHESFMAWVVFLRIDKIIDWLNKKLTKK